MIEVVLGSGLLLLLVVDVFSTVFSTQGRGGPVNRRQNGLIWKAFHAFGTRPDGSTRDHWLALAGPTMVVTTLGIWVLWLVLGFALVYYPWMESFLVSPGSLRTPWVEALYFSGYTAATLGYGDLVPDSEVLRLLALAEAAAGFALVPVSVTYFLAVYREVIAKHSLALDISGLFQAGEEGVVEFVRTEGYDALARWSEQLSSSFSSVLLSHFQYPVLHYFRPVHESRAIPIQLGAVLRFRRLVRPDDESPAVRTLARHPSYLALQAGIDEYLQDVDTLFVPGGGGADYESYASLERAHQRLLDCMLHSRPRGGE